MDINPDLLLSQEDLDNEEDYEEDNIQENDAG